MGFHLALPKHDRSRMKTKEFDLQVAKDKSYRVNLNYDWYEDTCFK